MFLTIYKKYLLKDISRKCFAWTRFKDMPVIPLFSKRKKRN